MALNNPRCQCDPSCKDPPLDGLPFCEKHNRNGCPRVSPTTLSYPVYSPDKFNKFPGVKQANNCFAYAFDYIRLPKNKCTKESCPISFPQPGRKSGYPKWSEVKGKRCPDLIARLKGDIPNLSIAKFTQKCPIGNHKIVVVTDEDEDYHFYRQDRNGYWSHKPGGTDATRLDSTGRPIYDPALASRTYSATGLNYDNFCGYMCVPAKKRDHKLRGGTRRYKQRKQHKQRKHTVRKHKQRKHK